MKRIVSRLSILSLCLLLPVLAANASGQTTHTELPPGFIALSESRMFWRDAITYCQQQGGRLPLINKSDSWDGSDTTVSDTVTIDAFGVLGTDWLADLPRAFYWTGTQYSEPGYSGYAWAVRVVRDNLISVIAVKAEDTILHVICVPQ